MSLSQQILKLGSEFHLWEKLMVGISTSSCRFASEIWNASISENSRSLEVTKILGIISSFSLINPMPLKLLIQNHFLQIWSFSSVPSLWITSSSIDSFHPETKGPFLRIWSLSILKPTHHQVQPTVSLEYLFILLVSYNQPSFLDWSTTVAWPASTLGHLLQVFYQSFSNSDLTELHSLTIYLSLHPCLSALDPLLFTPQSHALALLHPQNIMFALNSSHLSSRLTSSLNGSNPFPALRSPFISVFAILLHQSHLKNASLPVDSKPWERHVLPLFAHFWILRIYQSSHYMVGVQ